MRNVFAVCLLSVLSFGQSTPRVTNHTEVILPGDLKARTFSCSTQRVVYKDKDGNRHYHYRAMLYGLRDDGDKWESTLGFRSTEKLAARDCQLWQELSNNEKQK